MQSVQHFAEPGPRGGGDLTVVSNAQKWERRTPPLERPNPPSSHYKLSLAGSIRDLPCGVFTKMCRGVKERELACRK